MDTVERRDRQSNTSLYNILFKDGFKRNDMARQHLR